MGCCLSAGGRNHEAEQRRSIDGEPPTSPRRILEVETVKEVLLETPVAPKADEKIDAMPPEKQEWKPEIPPAPAITGKDDTEIVSEISEISEVCSYSESLSTTAAQDGGAAVDDGVVDQRPPPRKRRAPGGGRGRGERLVARRTAAPEKRGQVSPLRQARGRAPRPPPPRNGVEENGDLKRKDPPPPPRNGVEENGDLKRKDVVESTGRRSRSPVKREEVAPPRNESDEKAPAAAAETRNDVVLAEEAETLENPVVSLECFIFL